MAASYPPESALFVKNESGITNVQSLQDGSPPATDRVRKLYRERREALYEALMGAVLIIPEGNGLRLDSFVAANRGGLRYGCGKMCAFADYGDPHAGLGGCRYFPRD